MIFSAAGYYQYTTGERSIPSVESVSIRPAYFNSDTPAKQDISSFEEGIVKTETHQGQDLSNPHDASQLVSLKSAKRRYAEEILETNMHLDPEQRLKRIRELEEFERNLKDVSINSQLQCTCPRTLVDTLNKDEQGTDVFSSSSSFSLRNDSRGGRGHLPRQSSVPSSEGSESNTSGTGDSGNGNAMDDLSTLALSKPGNRVCPVHVGTNIMAFPRYDNSSSDDKQSGSIKNVIKFRNRYDYSKAQDSMLAMNLYYSHEQELKPEFILVNGSNVIEEPKVSFVDKIRQLAVVSSASKSNNNNNGTRQDMRSRTQNFPVNSQNNINYTENHNQNHNENHNQNYNHTQNHHQYLQTNDWQDPNHMNTQMQDNQFLDQVYPVHQDYEPDQIMLNGQANNQNGDQNDDLNHQQNHHAQVQLQHQHQHQYQYQNDENEDVGEDADVGEDVDVDDNLSQNDSDIESETTATLVHEIRDFGVIYRPDLFPENWLTAKPHDSTSLSSQNTGFSTSYHNNFQTIMPLTNIDNIDILDSPNNLNNPDNLDMDDNNNRSNLPNNERALLNTDVPPTSTTTPPFIHEQYMVGQLQLSRNISEVVSPRGDVDTVSESDMSSQVSIFSLSIEEMMNVVAEAYVRAREPLFPSFASTIDASRTGQQQQQQDLPDVDSDRLNMKAFNEFFDQQTVTMPQSYLNNPIYYPYPTNPPRPAHHHAVSVQTLLSSERNHLEQINAYYLEHAAPYEDDNQWE